MIFNKFNEFLFSKSGYKIRNMSVLVIIGIVMDYVCLVYYNDNVFAIIIYIGSFIINIVFIYRFVKLFSNYLMENK